MKKKLISIMLIVTMAITATACGAQKTEPDVKITIPAIFSEDIDTELDAEDKAEGIKEIVKNSDGSVTTTMTAAAHKKQLTELKSEIDDSIEDLLEDKENYPSFEKITYNDTVTEFTVSVDSAKFNEMETMACVAFYIEGSIYQLFNSVSEDKINIVINFVDKDTGDVIKNMDSSGLNDVMPIDD